MKERKYIYEYKFKLDRQGIDNVSEYIENHLSALNYKREQVLRIKISFEEALLNAFEHIEAQGKDSANAELYFVRRMGVRSLIIRYESESFDPTQPEEGSEEDVFSSSALKRLGFTPEWGFAYGKNQLSLKLPQKPVKSEAMMLVAIAAALVFAVFKGAAPTFVVDGLVNSIFSPLSDAFYNMLSTFIGIMIFLSVVSGVTSIGNISEFSRMGKRVIGRFTLDNFAFAVIPAVCMIPFFRLNGSGEAAASFNVKAVFDLILSMIPGNPVSPFADGNVIQIIIISVMVGTALLLLGSRANNVRVAMSEADGLFMLIIEIIIKLLPFYIFTSLCVLFYQNGIGIFINLYKPILLVQAVVLVQFLVQLFIASFVLKHKPGALFSKIKETMFIGLTTASSSIAFGRMIEINEHRLGISRRLNHFATPIGNMMESQTIAAIYLSIIYYLAEYYSVPVNLGWFIIAYLLCSILAITTPPVVGGPLMCVGLLMTQTGIPSEGLALAGVLLLITDFFATCSKIGMSHLRVAMDAKALGMLDEEVLYSS